MNRFAILLLVICMLFSISISAQKKRPGSIQWKIVAEIPGANNSHISLGLAGPVTGTQKNIMIVAGGANFPDSMPWVGGKKKYYDEVFVFVKRRNSVIPLNKAFKLPENIAYTACCSTEQGVLYAGGENENGITDKAYLLQWDEKTSSLITKNLPSLPIVVTNATATAHKNLVYIAGGESGAATVSQFIVLDLDNLDAGWKELPPVPQVVSHTVLLSVEDKGQAKIYLVGGRRKNTNGISDLYSFVFEFNVLENQWMQKTSLPYAISAGTGVTAGSDCLLLFGGDKGMTFKKVEILIAAISTEKNDTTKQQLTQQKNALLSSHPGFSKDVLLYNSETGECKVIAAIPFDSPVTTTAFWWDNVVVIPGGEIKAGVRTSQILMAKLKRWLK